MTRAFVWTLLALTACAPDVVQHGATARLAVEGIGCHGEDRTAGADHFRVRSLQDGARFVEQVGAIADGWPAEIAVPTQGTAQVRVEVFAGEPASGQLVAWGQSRGVAEGLPRAGATFTVTLASPGRFSEVCAGLVRARSGHTATVLGDDRVLVTGGFTSGEASALSSIEAYSPFESSSVEIGDLSVVSSGTTILLPTGNHAAVRVAPAQVLVWSGERRLHDAPVPLTTRLVFDADVLQCGVLPNSPYGPVARASAALAAVGTDVFAFGGQTPWADGGVPVRAVERLDTTTMQQTLAGTLDDARDGAALAATSSGQAVLAGGLADGGVSAELDVLQLRASLGSPWKGALLEPRWNASAIALGEAFLVAGGIDGSGADVGSTEWVRLGTPVRVEAGPSIAPRASPCLAVLGDGRVLVLGGTSGGQPSASAELISTDGTVVTVGFPGAPRRGHTCTTLSDGSVLVTGGVTSGGVALSDAWRFVPEPPP